MSHAFTGMKVTPPSASPHTTSGVVFDSFETIPELAPLRVAVEAQSWEGVEAHLAVLAPASASFAIGKLSEREGIDELLEEAVDSRPQSVYAKTALAARYMTLGWTARSSAVASDLTEEQVRVFADWTRTAEQVLIAACALQPDFAPARSARVTTVRALELGASEAWRRYRQLDALSPHNYIAQCQLLQYLLPKWFGTDGEALAFARKAASAAPQGTNSGALVAICHIEHWLSVGGGPKGLAHFKQAEVYNELVFAAKNSVLHSDHILDGMGIEAHNAFAMAFWLGEHFEDAAAHFRALDGRATTFPWSYMADLPAELGRPIAGAALSVSGGLR